MTLNSQQASLRSAFRPPQRFVGTEKWFRNPKNHRMQLQTNHCQIHFGRASRWSSLYGSINKIKREVITVASASESERLETLVSLVKAADGFTKCGIYAWFEGREDVVTFPVDLTMTKKLESVTFVLVTHLKRLSISMLRTQASGAVTIPKYYVNFKMSIFRQVIPSLTSNSRPLPHLYFIGTTLLPCGPVNPKVENLIGNGDIGPANDHMTNALHSFAHFSAIYPKQPSSYAIFKERLIDLTCEEQCVIDPQSHSSQRKAEHYWDQGEKAVFAFLDQQKEACQTNWVCNTY